MIEDLDPHESVIDVINARLQILASDLAEHGASTQAEIEAEVVELAELDAVAAELDGPQAADDATARATAAITVVALSVSGRTPAELDAETLEAVAVIARAAAEVVNSSVSRRTGLL